MTDDRRSSTASGAGRRPRLGSVGPARSLMQSRWPATLQSPACSGPTTAVRRPPRTVPARASTGRARLCLRVAVGGRGRRSGRPLDRAGRPAAPGRCRPERPRWPWPTAPADPVARRSRSRAIAVGRASRPPRRPPAQRRGRRQIAGRSIASLDRPTASPRLDTIRNYRVQLDPPGAGPRRPSCPRRRSSLSVRPRAVRRPARMARRPEQGAARSSTRRPRARG